MKHPNRSDFQAHIDGSAVVVLFEPTKSYFRFALLDPSEWEKHGRVSHDAVVRHSKCGDTAEYIDSEVGNLALDVAQRYTSQAKAGL